MTARRGSRKIRGLAGLAIFSVAACVQDQKPAPIPGNLLDGVPAVSEGVGDIDRLTDGLAALEGDFWDTGLTSKFANPQGHVTWDLGASKKVGAGLVQGDNNDVYILSGSQDGKTFQPLWNAPPAAGPGMRLRQGTFSGTARYLRLTGQGGDNLFSVGELAVFSDPPAGWPKITIARAEGVSAEAGGSGWGVSLGILGAAVAILLFLSRKRKPTDEPVVASGPAGSDAPPPAAPPAS